MTTILILDLTLISGNMLSYYIRFPLHSCLHLKFLETDVKNLFNQLTTSMQNAQKALKILFKV